MSRRRRATPLQRQQGVALITVMLVFFIAVTIATQVLTRSHLTIARTNALLANSQLRGFVAGAEAWSIVALQNDFQSDQDRNAQGDHAQEPWAQVQRTFNPDNGRIRIHLRDMQACFNVNNLAVGTGTGTGTGNSGGNGGGNGSGASDAGDGGGNGATNADQFQILRNYLTRNQVDPNLANAIADWVDQDDTPRGLDTEDDGYLGMDIPYRTPDTFITDVSELRHVKGMTEEAWEKLDGLLCALPGAQQTLINVNSAPESLLSAIAPSVDGAAIGYAREFGGFNTFDELLQDQGLGIKQEMAGVLGVESRYFEALIAVELGDELAHRQYWKTLLALQTTTGRVTIVHRQRVEFAGDLFKELLEE
ncbi:type II secretion system minor pseudopilin GspK [Biformimicrobium ophioploci]|uniref:Type II secretion system protein K n=1 Tax=Biformimicrobium ophioploci TaxID=3036711 RepID=A0ABQ6M1L1_9GAMM|nr:type II secretion system minor pseudopilin GspK [Microbulbifer sp. NKW57]GMG88236.1 type II secretion system minor pseudopilin GspK [Microbulbifer sp. NKW57]